MKSVVLILLFLFIFLKQNRVNQFYIFSISIFFPFTFGDLRSIPDLMIGEWLAPIFLVILLNDMIPLKYAYREKKLLDINGIRILLFASLLLAFLAIYSYINNEIVNVDNLNPRTTGILRTYFGIFNNFVIFFATLIFINRNLDKIDFSRWLNLTVLLSILLGFMGIIKFFYNIDFPFLAGAFDYMPDIAGQFPMRLVSLERTSMIGIPAFLALSPEKRKYSGTVIFIFAAFIFLNGGRLFWISTATAVSAYFIFRVKSKSPAVFFYSLIAIVLAMIFLPQEMLEKQMGRLLKVEGGLEKLDLNRYYTYELYIRNFLESPIFGKGITDYKGFLLLEEEYLEFVLFQLFSGGHGSYISLLSTFGLLGLFYYVLLLISGIILSFKKMIFYLNKMFSEKPLALSTFVLLALIIKVIYSITGGNGIKDDFIFFSVGLIAGLRVYENSDHNKKLTDNI